MIQKPVVGAYPAFFQKYMDLVEGDGLQFLENQHQVVLKILKSIPEELGNYRYAEGKWTIKDLIGHCNDTERIMAYRSLCFARGESANLPGFDEDSYAAKSNASSRPLKDHIEEFDVIRRASLSMFRGFEPSFFEHTGTANGKAVQLSAMLYIIPGHYQHHIQILQTRYLNH